MFFRFWARARAGRGVTCIPSSRIRGAPCERALGTRDSASVRSGARKSTGVGRTSISAAYAAHTGVGRSVKSRARAYGR